MASRGWRPEDSLFILQGGTSLFLISDVMVCAIHVRYAKTAADGCFELDTGNAHARACSLLKTVPARRGDSAQPPLCIAC